MPPVKRRKAAPVASTHARATPTSPAASLYRTWRLGPPPALREAAWRRLDALTERHIQSIWYDSQYRPASLLTTDGESVIVKSTGRWNLSSGPDFLDACLVVGPERRTLRGDVEIHIHPEDWTRHAHGRDPLYRAVIAHVTYWPGRLAADILPAGAIQLALKPGLDADPNFFFENIDVTAYPYSIQPRDTRGDPPPLAGLTPDAVTALLTAAGTERLRLKSETLATQIERVGAPQALFEGILAALGYQHNRATCRRLARLVTLARLREEAEGRPEIAYALLMGAAGLLPKSDAMTPDTDGRRFLRTLWDIWWKMQSRWENLCLTKQAWRLTGIRPHNHPARRLAAAAAIFTMSPALEQSLLTLDTSNPDAWRKSIADWLDPRASIPYWSNHLAIGGRRQTESVALVGAARQASIIANVVIPFLAASGRDIAPLLPTLPPEDVNQIHRQTGYLVFGPNFNPTPHHRGLQQQGLLQLFHDYCLTNRLADLTTAAREITAACSLPAPLDAPPQSLR